ncbi:MAG: metallopeptidase TldD-related protein [Blastomonas sp.]
MLTSREARERAESLVELAIRQGASAADAIFACSSSTDVQMRLGKLEDVQRSESAEIGLRVFDGQRVASVSGSDISDAGLATLAERAVAMARVASEDRFACLAPEDLLFSGNAPDLELDDGGDPAPEHLREMALQAEDAARAIQGITNSEGGSAGAGRSIVALATSHGFSGHYTASRYGCGASVLAGGDGAMERDQAFHSARHLADLESPESIGTRAGERAVARLNPEPVRGGAMPVVLDPRIGASMLGHLLGAIGGSAIARKTSFLLDKRNAPVFDSSITVIDDPLRRRGLRSRWFDGEGVATKRSELVSKGVLNGWLMDAASARQLGERPTGHAARGTSGGPGVGSSNVHIEPGALAPEALMADIATGIYVTELIGQGVNGVTGDYSRGANGFVIRDGRIGHAVSEITIAGNLVDMFAAMQAASDLEFRRMLNVPTLRIDAMTVASG